MPHANPLLNGVSAYADAPAVPQSTLGAMYPQSPQRATGIQPPLTGDHNTPAHVAFVVLAAMAVIVFLHISGFRFVVDAGVARGR